MVTREGLCIIVKNTTRRTHDTLSSRATLHYVITEISALETIERGSTGDKYATNPYLFDSLDSFLSGFHSAIHEISLQRIVREETVEILAD